MTQKERLVELLENAPGHSNVRYKSHKEMMEDLADYLLQNGVIVPPCRVGDTVYKLNIDCAMPYDYDCDDNCYSCKHMISNVVEYPVRSCDNQVIVMNFYGKYYFPTREAAEQALKECDQHE